MLSEIRHQEQATRFLRRVVQGSLASPLLLVGPSGVGKRTSLLCMTREIFCTGTRTAGCECAACFQVQRDLHSDVHTLTAGKSIEVKEIRALVVEAGNRPSASKLNVFIIDGADRFTVEAADALLKTLEEPSTTTRFFLLAEDVSSVPATIRSRCGAIVYRPLPEKFILSIVQRSESDPVKALVYSKMGVGSAGRALDYCRAGRLLLRDQVLKTLQATATKDLPSVFSLVDTMKGDIDLVLVFAEQLVHDVLIATLDPMQVIHVDVADILEALSSAVPKAPWVGLARKLGALRTETTRLNLNLQFQLKTVLAESFVV